MLCRIKQGFIKFAILSMYFAILRCLVPLRCWRMVGPLGWMDSQSICPRTDGPPGFVCSLFVCSRMMDSPLDGWTSPAYLDRTLSVTLLIVTLSVTYSIAVSDALNCRQRAQSLSTCSVNVSNALNHNSALNPKNLHVGSLTLNTNPTLLT